MIAPGNTFQLWISSAPEAKDDVDEDDSNGEDNESQEEGSLLEQVKLEKKSKKVQKLPPSLDLENANAMSPYLAAVPEGEWGLFCDLAGRVIAQQVDLVLEDAENNQDDDLQVTDITSTPAVTAPNSPSHEAAETNDENEQPPKVDGRPNTVLLVSVGSPGDNSWQSESLGTNSEMNDEAVSVEMDTSSLSGEPEGADLTESDQLNVDNSTPSVGENAVSPRDGNSEVARMRLLHEDIDLKGYPCIKNTWYATRPAFDCDLVDDFTIINTTALAKDVRKFLKELSIPLGEFSKQQLNRKQGTLSDLLNHPKEWKNLSQRGKDIYLKMMKFLSAPNLRDLVLKMRPHKMKRRAEVDCPASGHRIINCLPNDMLLGLAKGEMPSEEMISSTATACVLDQVYLRQHCIEQLKYLDSGQTGSYNDAQDAAPQEESVHWDSKSGVDSGTQTDVSSSNLRKRANGLLPKFLDRHICTHFGCGAILQSKPCFDSHLRCHAGIRTYRCCICEKSFSSRYNLNSHLKVHDSNKISKREKERMILAGGDTEDFYKTVHMTKHKKEHLRQMKYLCGLCWEGFPSRVRLSKHLLSQHKVCEKSIRGGFTCYACAKSFKNSGTLVVHMRTHTNTRPYECNFCKMGFHTKANLQRHERTHTGEKPFSCPLCRATFTEARSVAVHMRIHTGEKPYKCPTCGKAFAQQSPLQAHLLIHQDLKPHLCELCGQSFRQKANLVSHVKRHRGLNQHKCPECGSSFFKKSDCLRHMLRHLSSSERHSYRCDSCCKAFMRLEQLRQHQKKHQFPAIKCPHCDKKFCDEAARRKHLRLKLPPGSLDTFEGDIPVCLGLDNPANGLQQNEKGTEFSQMADNKNSPLYIAKALFSNEKHYIITAVSPLDSNARDKSSGVEMPTSQATTSGSIILTPCNQDGIPTAFQSTAHSVFLQGVNLSGQQLSMSGSAEMLSQHSILFADDAASVSDGSLRMSLAAEDEGCIKDRNTNMVEDSDPNMQSVIVETTEENIIVSQDRVMNTDPDKQLKLGDTISAYQVIVPCSASENSIMISMDDDQQVGMTDSDLGEPGASSHATLLGTAMSQEQSVTEQHQIDPKGQTYIVVDLELE